MRREQLERAEGIWRPLGLASRFDLAARRHPDRPFVITDNAELSYADVRAWSSRLACGLYALGVRPGDSVALVVDNRPEFIAVKLAIARIGAVAVPINFAYRGDELATVLRQSHATVLVSIAASFGVDHLAVMDQVVPGWESGATTASLPHLRQVLTVETAVRAGARDLAWLADQGSPVPEDAVQRLTERVDPDGPCDIVFTSGTSGHALGAVL